MVTTTLETYFWMVDRLGIEDDTRNKVNMTKNNVVLGKPFIKKLENGHYIGRLLNDMYHTYSQRTNKQFTVAQGISEIDAESATYNQDSWRVIFEALANYGVEIGTKRQNIILQTQKTDYIVDIMDALFEIDGHPQGSLGAAMRRKLDIRTKFGEKKSAMYAQRHQSITDNQSEESGQVSPMKSPLKVPGSVRQRRGSIKLAPIEGGDHRSSLQIQKSPQQRLLGREQLMTQDGLSVNDLDEIMPTDLSQARTSVQFILTSLSNGYDMKPKQAAALLANNHKVLQHLCIKGGKGSDFTKVQGWYQMMIPNAQQLVYLINTEKKDVLSYGASYPIQSPGSRVPENRSKILHKTLNILKSGFYSRNSEVQLLTGDLFVTIVTAINQQSHEMMMDLLDWFMQSTVIPEYNRSAARKGVTINDPKSNYMNKNNNAIIGAQENNEIQLSKDIEHFQYETGLQALYHAYTTNIDFVPIISQILLVIGRGDPYPFFTQSLPQQAPNWSVSANLQLDFFSQTLDQPYAVQLLESSGVVKSWAQNCYQVFESNGEVPFNDRVVSLIFLAELWRTRPAIVENAIHNASQTIVRMLKRAARDMQRTLVVISIELLFRVLETFAKQKHHYAPNIYKTLTFLLVEFYWEVDVREMMLSLFVTLFNNSKEIPINILCEPLFKQIELSQYHVQSFNVFDFEFFKYIAMHQKLDQQTGFQMMETLSKIALASVFYQQSAIKLVEFLMNRFAYAVEDMQLHWQTQFKNMMGTLVAIQARLIMHRINVRNEENNFFNRLALRGKKSIQSGMSSNFTDQSHKNRLSDQEYQSMLMNEKLIVNLCEQLFRINFPEVSEELKYAVLDTYVGLQAQLRIESKALRYLIKLYTNKVDAMIDDWAIRYPNKATQLQIPFLQEIQELVRDNTKGSIYAPGAVDIYQSTKRLKVRNITSPKPRQTRDTLLSNNNTTMVSVALPTSAAAGNSQIKNTFKSIQQQNHLYDFNKWEEQWEVKQYMQYLKRNHRLYKQIHYVYSTQQEGAKKPHAVDKSTFGAYEKSSLQINAHSLFRLIKDFNLEFNQEHWYLLEEVKRLIKQINIHILKEPGTVMDLTFEGFIHFILQYAYYIYVTLNSGDIQIKKDEIRALTLVERLFNYISQQPKFKELNLTLTKTETTNRVQVDLLQKLDQKFIKSNEVPGNHKVLKEKAKFVDYQVPSTIPIPYHKKMCIEIMDEIVFAAIGQHFLEPIAVEKQLVKVVPKVQSIRTTSHTVQSPHVNPKPLPNKGLPAHRPLSYGHMLSMDQDQTKASYIEKHEKRHSVRPGEGASLQKVHEEQYGTQDKNNFKAQAINRRAKQFGEAMQLTIINEPMPSKQTMFEAAEVLNEVLKAVEQNKKALRLDFTPYRLYEMYKKKLPKPKEEEEVQEDDDYTKLKKKKMVQHFMEQENTRRQDMKQNLKDQRKQQLLAQEKEERLKKARDHEYQERKHIVMTEDERARQERLKQKQEIEKVASEQKRLNSAMAREKAHALTKKAKEDLAKLAHDRRGDLYDQLQLENKKEIKIKNTKDRWSKLHKKTLEKVEQQKTEARDQFYEWCRSDEVQHLLNKKYKLGLWQRYDQVLKMSKSISGVTAPGWIEFFKQVNMFHKIENKRLLRIHATQVKEMAVVDDHQYNKVFYSKTREGAAIPADRELSYGAFIAGLIKASNLFSLMEQEAKGKPWSQVKFPEYGEYQFPTDPTEGLESFLDQIKATTQENNVAKPSFQTTPYTQNKPPISPLKQR